MTKFERKNGALRCPCGWMPTYNFTADAKAVEVRRHAESCEHLQPAHVNPNAGAFGIQSLHERRDPEIDDRRCPICGGFWANGGHGSC